MDALVHAIRTGDVETLRRALLRDPETARRRVDDENGVRRTLLHVVTDWPGFFPRGPEIVGLLVEAGADPNAPIVGGRFPETPLHWAASSDDVEVAAALLDAGADLEAPGASIAGGSPLDDAVAYGCWHVARLLVARGARVDRLWHAAALGMTERVAELLATEPGATPDELTAAFWQACHGGQRRTAEYLASRGADVAGRPGYADLSAVEIAGSLDTRRETMVAWLREIGAGAHDPGARR